MPGRTEVHPNEDTILAAVVRDAPIHDLDQLAHPLLRSWSIRHTDRQITRQERELAHLHETVVKLRYECLEQNQERVFLKEKLEIRARVEVTRTQHNNATWLRRAWIWVGARLGVWL